MKSGKTFSWIFIAVIAVGAWWILSKLAPSSGIFTGITNQRGLQGSDQFGNPISPGSSGALSA